MNIIDIQDAALYAEVQFQRWKAEFEKEFNKPVADIILYQWWNNIPEAAKAELRKTVPEAVKNMEARMKGGNYG